MNFILADQEINSRLLMGSALYPSPQCMSDSIQEGQADVVTASIRRQNPGSKAGQAFWDHLQALNTHILPNTAGCRSVQEAVTTAHMAREIFNTHWIKLEVIGDEHTLHPDTRGLVEAAEILCREGFEVLPYTTDDLVAAERLADAGCRIIMPWAAPIGSGQGLLNPYALRILRERLPDHTLIVDAGLGRPSHAAEVMEMGFDAVLVNSAIALARDPVAMASAFRDAVRAGRNAFLSGMLPPRDLASPSTPVAGTPFWHQGTPSE